MERGRDNGYFRRSCRDLRHRARSAGNTRSAEPRSTAIRLKKPGPLDGTGCLWHDPSKG